MLLASAADGRNSFTSLRLIAATLVLVSHGFLVTSGDPLAEPLKVQTGMSLGAFSVGAFFALSGFLITQSWVRQPDLRRFSEKRFRRLAPALWVAVLLTAILFAPLSRLPIADYFAHRDFWRYLGNGVFLPRADGLPGVFDTWPFPSVNASLWTLKFEVACYAAVAVLGLLKLLRPWAVMACLVAAYVIVALQLTPTGIVYYIDMFSYQFRFFAVGALLFFFRDRVRASWWAVAACLAVMVAASYLGVAKELAPFCVGYATIAIGTLARLPEPNGDYSYGIYVYAFPVQQLMYPASMAFAFPSLANIALSLPVVVLLGWLSWRIVEQPALRFKVKPKPVSATA